jgi:DNA-directed RNA polymerase subunit M/transcription elongation factor TFIIS
MFGIRAGHSDPAREWRQLQEHYTRLSDDGLRAAANEAYCLTEMARAVLRDEIRSRRLDVQLKTEYELPERGTDPAQDGGVDPADLELDLVALFRAWSEDEARRLKEALDAASIPSYMGPENAEHISDLRAGFEDGIDVKVRAVDRNRALWALSLRRSSQKEAPEEDAEYKVVCPRCKSPEIVFRGLEDDGTGAQRSQFHWSCDVCGNQWRDDGVEERV